MTAVPVVSVSLTETPPPVDMAVSLPTIVQWQPFELELIVPITATPNEKYRQVTLTATFHGPAGATFAVSGFWDGGNVWRVRFAPPKPGEWSYTLDVSDDQMAATRQTGTFRVEPATADHVTTNPNFRGFLRVSDNGRYLTYADGTPFFWLGDTIWAGNLMAMAFTADTTDVGPDVAEFPTYIADRQAKGFTTLQIIAGYPDKPERINEGGSTLLPDGTTINPAYFQWLDRRIQLIIDSGMVPVITGQWESAVIGLPLAELKAYWDYLLSRYQGYNVVWVTSGEYGFVEDLNKVRNLSAHIGKKATVGQLITIHPTPNKPHFAYSSSTHFADDAWIDLHLHQTWDQEATRNAIVADYALKPTRPIISGEAGYDGLWTWDRQKVRQDAWTAYFSGAAGYTYGVLGIWNWNDGCCDNQRWGVTPRWYDVIDLPSSMDMARLAQFFDQIEWWELTPNDSLVSSGYALTKPGEMYLVYLPFADINDDSTSKLGALLRWAARQLRPMAVTLNLPQTSRSFQGRWYNPATGDYTPIDDAIIGGSDVELTPPFIGDAVLYIIGQ